MATLSRVTWEAAGKSKEVALWKQIDWNWEGSPAADFKSLLFAVSDWLARTLRRIRVARQYFRANRNDNIPENSQLGKAICGLSPAVSRVPWNLSVLHTGRAESRNRIPFSCTPLVCGDIWRLPRHSEDLRGLGKLAAEGETTQRYSSSRIGQSRPGNNGTSMSDLPT